MMKIIGLTGGIGSGKSKILSYMQDAYSAVICQADHVAWELQKPGQICYEKIIRCFGREILNEDGTIERKKLGEIVFQNQDKLLELNQIMHPAVKTHINEMILEEKRKNTAYFILEAALLLEENYALICDEIWYIYSSEEVRRNRLKENRKYSDEKIDAIMSNQLSDDVFRKECRIMIDNSGDFRDTCYQIEKVMK